MKRRDLLTGFALAAAGVSAEPADTESLYVPKAHRVEDRSMLHDFMDEYAFADLITAGSSIRVTHLPTLLDRKKGTFGTIYGHVAKNNPQYTMFDGKSPAVLVFRGPHAYISPSWFTKPGNAVPTWNFAVVHVSGKPKAVTDKPELHAFLGRLISKFETRYGGSSYDFSKLPESYVYGMLGGIVGFEMEIEAIDGKFKLSQERNEGDRASIEKHLEHAKEGRSIGELTSNFYSWVTASTPPTPKP